jgi:hypothetical protein
LGLGLGLTAAPVLFMGASGGFAIVGLFVAVWVGDNAFAKVVLTLAMVSVISLILGFVIIVF